MNQPPAFQYKLSIPLKILCLGLLFCLVNGCAVNPATGERDFVLLSEDQEIAMGRQYSKEVLKQYRPYDDPELQAYIQSVGERVSRISHRGNLYYRFTLLDSTEVNAFALPGGYIYITRGLLAYLNSEAELAAVLGHEVGHVTARHSVRQHGMATATQVISSVVGAATGVQGVEQLTQLLGVGIVRGYGREHELEADQLGAEYLSRSGYSPDAMQEVIGVLKNQEVYEQKLAKEEGRKPRSYHGLFSTHPDNDKRLQSVIASAKKYQHGSLENRSLFLQKIDGLTFGDSEQDGIRRGTDFYHGPLGFKLRFPDGWRVENRPSYLEANAPGGEGALHVAMEDLNKRLTPKQFIETRMGIKETYSDSALKVGEFSGHQAVVKGNNPELSRKVRLVVLFMDQRAFIFIGTARNDQEFKELDPLFLQSARSFARMHAKDQALAKEAKIRVFSAKPKTSYRSLAQDSPIAHHAEAQLRLLNGAYPSGEIKAGDLIKVVR